MIQVRTDNVSVINVINVSGRGATWLKMPGILGLPRLLTKAVTVPDFLSIEAKE